MALVHANLEANEENTRSIAVTLYFDSTPTREEVMAICKSTSVHGLGVDTTDPYCDFLTRPTPVSDRAGLVRIQCHPTC